MTLQGIEGFEITQHTNFMSRKYAAVNGNFGNNRQPGRLHGWAMQGEGGFRTISFGLKDEVVFGFGMRYRVSSISSGTVFPQIRLMNGAEEQCRIEFVRLTSTTYTWRLMRDTTELSQSTGTFTTLNWNYFEFKIEVDTTTGSIEFRRNENAAGTASGLNTADRVPAGQCDILDFQFQNTNVEIDDMYWLDTDTTEVTGDDDFLGDSVAEGAELDADGTTTNWTPSTGTTHYTLLQGVALPGAPLSNEDNKYVSATTAGTLELFSFADFAFIKGTIHGVALSYSARTDVAGSKTLKAKIRSNATNYDNPATGGGQFVPNGTATKTFTQILSVDPDTSAKWTLTNLNAAEFGMEVVA